MSAELDLPSALFARRSVLLYQRVKPGQGYLVQGLRSLRGMPDQLAEWAVMLRSLVQAGGILGSRAPIPATSAVSQGGARWAFLPLSSPSSQWLPFPSASIHMRAGP